MRTIKRLLLSTTVVVAAGPAPMALAAEAVMLRAGGATGPNAVFAFDKAAKPHRIVVRTTQAGVVGSRIEVFVDKAKNARISPSLCGHRMQVRRHRQQMRGNHPGV